MPHRHILLSVEEKSHRKEMVFSKIIRKFEGFEKLAEHALLHKLRIKNTKKKEYNYA